MSRTRPYVGLNSSKGIREVFRSATEPTEATHGHIYCAVIGPFKTTRGARFMGDYGSGNPILLNVADAEYAAKLR